MSDRELVALMASVIFGTSLDPNDSNYQYDAETAVDEAYNILDQIDCDEVRIAATRLAEAEARQEERIRLKREAHQRKERAAKEALEARR